jgi:fructokinase
MVEKHYGSIEAGGTKFVLAVADANMQVLQKESLPTTTPAATLQACVDFFTANPVVALGVGSFGPIDINEQSATYGHILKTPKPGWANADVVGTLKAGLHIPVAFTTDVNASAYGEYIGGRAKDADSVVYFTIGTGIGGGAVQNGHFIGGIAHAEMGHALVTLHPDDHFAGSCPFHGNRCFEGVASGPAIEARTGQRGENLPRTNPVFKFVAYYAAQMAFNAYVNLAPARIVFGGSVLSDAEMPLVRQYFAEFNHGYVQTPDLDALIQTTVVDGNGSATLGDLALAKALDVNQG